jgi:hypothetical protein
MRRQMWRIKNVRMKRSEGKGCCLRKRKSQLMWRRGEQRQKRGVKGNQTNEIFYR